MISAELTVAPTTSITGVVASSASIGAILTSGVDITATLNGVSDITVKMDIGGVEFAEYPDYKGSYTVTPGKNDQRINTTLKVVRDNITIKGVPAYEASNAFGGTTFSIG